jgi:hypothetical protein
LVETPPSKARPTDPGRFSGLCRLSLAGRPLFGPFLFLLGLLGLAARPFLLLVCHSALPSSYSQANMLRMRSDSTVDSPAGALPPLAAGPGCRPRRWSRPCGPSPPDSTRLRPRLFSIERPAEDQHRVLDGDGSPSRTHLGSPFRQRVFEALAYADAASLAMVISQFLVTRLIKRSPRTKRLMLSAISFQRRSTMPSVHPELCGVAITLGN